MRRFAAALVAILVLSPMRPGAQELLPPPITDQAEALAFLALFEGEWRGRGEARAAFDEEFEESLCNLQATFDTPSATLTNDGRCANARRGVDVGGTLALLPEGRLGGGFFIPRGAELISSAGQLLQDRLFVEVTYRSGRAGGVDLETVVVQVWVSKPVVSPGGIPNFGLIVLVRNPAGEFVDFSRMVFTARS